MSLKKVEKLEKNTVQLTIAVEGEEFAKATERAYRKEVKRINVPGFRKGKAPRRMIEKLYGESIFYEDAVNSTYPEAYSKAVDEADIDPIAQPEVNIEGDITNDGYTFTAKVEVKPEANLKKYKGLEVEKTIYSVEPNEIDAELKRLQMRNSRLVTVERPAELTDTVNIDYEGTVDGVPFEGGKAEKFDLKLGSNTFIPGFEDGLVGMKAGDETDVNVTFPEDYHAKELAGKAAVFAVKVNEVKATEVDEIDDEFAKDVSEFETLDELKADIEKKLKTAKDSRSDSELTDRLMDALIENLDVELGDTIIENEIDDIAKDFDYRLSMQGLNLETYLKYTNMEMADFRKSFRDQAEHRVRVRLALEKVAELEKLEITADDLEQEYKRLGEQYGMEAENIKNIISERMVKKDIAVARAGDIVKKEAKITEVAYKEPEAEADAKAEEKPKAKRAAKTAKKEPAQEGAEAEAKPKRARRTAKKTEENTEDKAD